MPHSQTDVLPIIDFAPFLQGDFAARQKIGKAIDRACRTGGIFYLTQHDIDPHVIERGFHQARLFFDLPRAEKQKIAITNSSCHRGWFDSGGEALDTQNQPQGDYKEGIKIGCDLPPTHALVQQKIALHGPNQWPDLPDWQGDMQTAYDAFATLAKKLMQAIALGLGLTETYFDNWLAQPMATLAPLRYPPIHTIHKDKGNNCPPPQAPTQAQIMSAGAHTDFGCLALLAQDDIAGLQIRTQNGTWQTILPRKASLIVNIGDMLELWTGGLYRAPEHRVLNTSHHMRHSLAFFYDPQYDTPLRVLPTCPQAHDKSHDTKADKQPPITALAYLLQKIDASFAYHKHNNRHNKHNHEYKYNKETP